MNTRKIKVSWADIDGALTGAGVISPSEEIREITLIKPRQMLIYLRRQEKSKTVEIKAEDD